MVYLPARTLLRTAMEYYHRCVSGLVPSSTEPCLRTIWALAIMGFDAIAAGDANMMEKLQEA